MTNSLSHKLLIVLLDLMSFWAVRTMCTAVARPAQPSAARATASSISSIPTERIARPA